MAHPDRLIAIEAGEEAVVVGDRHGRRAVLTLCRRQHVAAELARHQLGPVADPEHRNSPRPDTRIGLWRVGVVHGVRAARQDDRTAALDLLPRRVVRDQLGVDVQLADAPRDQLGELTSEVEDDDRIRLAGFRESRRRTVRRGRFEGGLEVRLDLGVVRGEDPMAGVGRLAVDGLAALAGVCLGALAGVTPGARRWLLVRLGQSRPPPPGLRAEKSSGRADGPGPRLSRGCASPRLPCRSRPGVDRQPRVAGRPRRSPPASGRARHPARWTRSRTAVTHPQARLAALRVVRLRTAPVLGEEERQPPPRAGQVRLGIDRPQDGILGDARVELPDEPLEERASRRRGRTSSALRSPAESISGRPRDACNPRPESKRPTRWCGRSSRERRIRLFFDCSSVVGRDGIVRRVIDRDLRNRQAAGARNIGIRQSASGATERFAVSPWSRAQAAKNAARRWETIRASLHGQPSTRHPRRPRSSA